MLELPPLMAPQPKFWQAAEILLDESCETTRTLTLGQLLRIEGQDLELHLIITAAVCHERRIYQRHAQLARNMLGSCKEWGVLPTEGEPYLLSRAVRTLVADDKRHAVDAVADALVSVAEAAVSLDSRDIATRTHLKRYIIGKPVALFLIESVNLLIWVEERDVGEPLPVAKVRSVKEDRSSLVKKVADNLRVANLHSAHQLLVGNGESLYGLEEIVAQVAIETPLNLSPLLIRLLGEDNLQVFAHYFKPVSYNPIEQEIYYVGKEIQHPKRQMRERPHDKTPETLNQIELVHPLPVSTDAKRQLGSFCCCV